MVTKFDAGYIVGRCPDFGGNAHHVAGRDIEKLRGLVDKACHQPGAGNAVDFRAFAGNPLHGFTSFDGMGSMGVRVPQNAS
jgi:hypothetical protein